MNDLVPEGTYRAVATPSYIDGIDCYAQFGFAGEKKTKQVLVTFEILDGTCVGRKVPWWGFFTAKTYERTVESLRACGFRGDDLAALMEQKIDNEVEIVVEHTEWNGTKSARVRWVNATGGTKLANQMSVDDLRAFAAIIKAKVAAIKEIEGKKAERSATAGQGQGSGGGVAGRGNEPDPGLDDNCPF